MPAYATHAFEYLDDIFILSVAQRVLLEETP
jgi:hypothetical protein